MGKQSRPPVILLEFNELTPSLIDRFIAEGHLPNFKRFRDESRAFITEAPEREPNLEPWIQWVTVHTGVNQRGHGVFHLDEGHKVTCARVWDVLAEHGHRTWICGSMNAAARETQHCLLMPDPWSSKVPPTPPELATYFSFVRQQVLEHTNDRVPLSVVDYLRFLTFMATHGLSLKTVVAICRQLLAERAGDRQWQRVVLLDRLQFDVFAHYYRRFKPAFSTFFLNSTAHYQHAYWEHMEPELFAAKGSAPAVEGHGDAILFGYKRMDQLLGEMFERFKDATLVLSTALSQEAWTAHKQENGGAFYRPKDVLQFVRMAGIVANCTAAPVMSEQFHVEFRDEAAARDAEAKLSALQVGQRRLLYVQRDGSRLFAGCAVADVPSDASVRIGGRDRGFEDLFYKVPTAKTGMHHPDGVLWFRLQDRQHVDGGRVPLSAVAPTLLSLLQVAPHPQMESGPLSLELSDRFLRAIA